MTPFSYRRPSSIEEAVAMKAAAGPASRYLAGGTNLYDLMKLNVEQPMVLIDITALPELAAFDTGSPGDMRFGALSRMSDVAEDALLVRNYPLLAEALQKAASQQLRNMASVGGNLLQKTRCAYFRNTDFPCNKRNPGSGCPALEGINRSHAVLATGTACIATYPGDWAVALMAMDAQVDVVGSAGRRTIGIASLYGDVARDPSRETVLASDELIVRLRVPKSLPGRASTYHKVRDRESYAFALASAAVLLRMDGLRVAEARIALGGVAMRPYRAAEAEQFIKGKVLNEATARQAAEAAFAGAEPRLHNAYKIPLGVATVTDALLIARRRSPA